MDNEKDLEQFSRFAGQNAETPKNLTNDEMLTVIHEHIGLTNLIEAYKLGLINETKFNELVQQGIEQSKNPEGK